MATRISSDAYTLQRRPDTAGSPSAADVPNTYSSIGAPRSQAIEGLAQIGRRTRDHGIAAAGGVSAAVRTAYRVGTRLAIAPGLDNVQNIAPFLATAAKEVYSAGASRFVAEVTDQAVEYRARSDPSFRTGVLLAVTLLGVARTAMLATLLIRRRRTTSQQEVNAAYLARQEPGNRGSTLFHVSNAVTAAELVGIPLAAMSLDLLMQRGHNFPGVVANVDPAQWAGLLLRDEIFSLLRDYLVPTLKLVGVDKPAIANAGETQDPNADGLTLTETAIQGARFGLAEQFLANIGFDYASNAAGPGPTDAAINPKRALARAMMNTIPEWWDGFAVNEMVVGHLRASTPGARQVVALQAPDLKAGFGERLLDHSSSRVGNYHLDRMVGALAGQLPAPGPGLISNEAARTFAGEFIRNIFVSIAIGAAYPLQTGQLQVFALQRKNQAAPAAQDEPSRLTEITNAPDPEIALSHVPPRSSSTLSRASSSERQDSASAERTTPPSPVNAINPAAETLTTAQTTDDDVPQPVTSPGLNSPADSPTQLKEGPDAYEMTSAGGMPLLSLSSDAARTLDAFLVAEPFLADVDPGDPQWAQAIRVVADMDSAGAASNRPAQ